jgi:hypothetical protein
MNIQQVKDGLGLIERYIPFRMPAMSWRFAAEPPDSAVAPEPDAWTCMFTFIDAVAGGKRLCLSADNPGCSGAACYLGFKKPGPGAGAFLAQKEKFKRSVEHGEAFYAEIGAIPAADRFLVLERVCDLGEGDRPEVVVLWLEAVTLAGMVTLANYDRPTNDNVLIPFASGCQGLWTMPYREKFEKLPRCVVGTMDPAVRAYLPKEVLTFSMPAARFAEIAENVEGSFLQTGLWEHLAK